MRRKRIPWIWLLKNCILYWKICTTTKVLNKHLLQTNTGFKDKIKGLYWSEFVQNKMEGTFSPLWSTSASCHSSGILSVTVLTVHLDLPLMIDLFSMFEMDIICLWTWHHWLVNSCEATQFWQRCLWVFFLLRFSLLLQHRECHRSIKFFTTFIYIFHLLLTLWSGCFCFRSVHFLFFFSMGVRVASPTFRFFGCPPFPLSHGVNDDSPCS